MARPLVFVACALFAVAVFTSSATAEVSATHKVGPATVTLSASSSKADQAKSLVVPASFLNKVCTKTCKETCEEKCADKCEDVKDKKCKTVETPYEECKDVDVVTTKKVCKNSCDESKSIPIDTKIMVDKRPNTWEAEAKVTVATPTIEINMDGKKSDSKKTGRKLASTSTGKAVPTIAITAGDILGLNKKQEPCLEICEDKEVIETEEKCEDKVKEEEKCEVVTAKKCKNECGPVCKSDCSYSCDSKVLEALSSGHNLEAILAKTVKKQAGH